MAHQRESGGNNDPNRPNGGSVCPGPGTGSGNGNGSTYNNAAHRHGRACWSEPPGRVSPELRLAVGLSAAGHCAPMTCLHWGAIVGQLYRDPLSLVGLGRPILLPLG